MARSSTVSAAGAALAAGLASGVLGCGGASTTASSQTATTKAASAPTSTTAKSVSSQGINRAGALNYAKAVNLRAGDLPGVPVSSTEHEAAVGAGGEQFAACSGAPKRSSRLVDVKSIVFKVGSGKSAGEVKSSVEVFPSSTLAARNFAAGGSARGRSCIVKLLPRLLGEHAASRVELKGMTVSKLAVPQSSASHAFGLRLRVSLIGKGLNSTRSAPELYIDALTLLAGPAEVALTALQLGGPPSPSIESRLFKLLAERARSHAA